MPAYVIVEVSYKEESWLRAYREAVPRIIAAYGGRYLIKSANPIMLEGKGQIPNTAAILEFPSLEAFSALLESPEYQPYRRARLEGAETRILVIE